MLRGEGSSKKGLSPLFTFIFDGISNVEYRCYSCIQYERVHGVFGRMAFSGHPSGSQLAQRYCEHPSGNLLAQRYCGHPNGILLDLLKRVNPLYCSLSSTICNQWLPHGWQI